MEINEIDQALKRAVSLDFFPSYGAGEPHLISLNFNLISDGGMMDISSQIFARNELIRSKNLLSDTMHIDKLNDKLTLRLTDKSGNNLIVIPNLTCENKDLLDISKYQQKSLKFELILGAYIFGMHNTIRTGKNTPTLLFDHCINNEPSKGDY